MIENVDDFDLSLVMTLMDKATEGLRGIIASYMCTWTSLWLIKLAFMVFFHGLGKQIRHQQILWWCALVYILASYGVTIGMPDFQCFAAS